MNIIPEEMKKDVLTKYPEKYHELLQKQMLAIEDTIMNNMSQYQYSQDFRKAIDIVLVDILKGKYLGVNVNES